MMKQTIIAMFAATVLLLSMGACSDKNDAPALPSQQEMEKSLVGLWYEDFEYKDLTEEGKPFNCDKHTRVLKENIDRGSLK